MHKWRENGLAHRKQVINSNFSEWQAVGNHRVQCLDSSYVPQRCISYAAVYIKDMDEGIKCDFSKFADDTQLVESREEGADRLQVHLNRSREWADTWQMPCWINVG